ncbi:winged helix-turn-helix domain-containing protein [Streptomyces sp. NPDC088788]|uniref:helix-turn-helix domain-containing protein n=1 Tax=Streptomyces sp. NPDC088788 TaxID=3365898 RepID=UPI003816DF08
MAPQLARRWPGGSEVEGPAKLPTLSDEWFALLEKELARSSAVHGWEDQRWTLERVQVLICPRFNVSCSIAGVWRLLHHHGWSWQSTARRSLERDKHCSRALE